MRRTLGRDALICCFAALGACHDEPTASDARQWFAGHRSTIDAMEERVLAAVEDHPYAGPPLTCDQIIAADPLKGKLEGSEDADVEPSIRCGNATSRWHERAVQRYRAWRPKLGKVLLRGTKLAGVEVRFRRREPLIARPSPWVSSIASGRAQWSAGCGDAGFAGEAYVAPEEGIAIGGYQVGWGLANLSFSHPGGASYRDDRDYPALFLRRRISRHGLDVQLRMKLLPQDDVPAEYLKLSRESCP